ncbi:MAG: putative porin [Petrimonas sp.]|nr:putative porin [Petrimonas sp.]
MRKKLLIAGLLCLWTVASFSQARIILPDSSQITHNRDSLDALPRRVPQAPRHVPDSITPDSLAKLPRFTAWKIVERTGERYAAPMDTALYNYQQTTLPDGYSVAMGYLGNLGSPLISKIFFDRKEKNQFVFYDAYYPYNKDLENRNFYSMRVPYSRLSYQSAGSQQNKEERLQALLTMNFGKKWNVGLEADYLHARGFYNSQAAKHIDWSVFGSYLSDRIEVHVFAATAGVTNFENGGISDDRFITQPDSIQQTFTAKDIPTKYTNTWNRLKTDQFYVSGRYNLGYNRKTANEEEKGEFVPVATLSITSHYRKQYRRFLSYDTVFVDQARTIRAIDTVYRNSFYPEAVDDSTRFSSFKNTVALSMREGFRPWVKFGLTAFLEHDVRNYSMIDTVGDKRMSHRENSVVVGGILNKQQGENLRFNLLADLGVLGYNIGEFRAMGTVETGFNIAGKRTELSAEAYIKNLKPKYLEENYQSKYFWWNKDFGDTRRVYAGGRLFIPFTNTTFSAGVENIQNYIYLDADKNPVQESGNVQVLSARVNQKLHFGIFNWDNDVVYQTSSDQHAIPVPMLSLYSNMYLKTKIVNELTLQFGVDAHFHTRYYAPGYEPALLQFYNQREKQVGDFPISTVYANMHLKQTRFFLMLYNIAPLALKPDYFSLPHYPVNPMLLKLGVSVNLHN